MQKRWEFLAAGSLALLTTGATPAVSPPPPVRPTVPPLRFDLTAFEAALNTAAVHRHLFAATKIDGGVIFAAMRNTLNAYRDLGVPARAVFPAAVLYHGAAVLLGFDDVMWNDYFIPLRTAEIRGHGDFVKDLNTVYDTKVRGNPCLHTGGAHGDDSIESLIADTGSRFFVCNNATRGFAGVIASHAKKPAADVYAHLAAHLVPNAMLVPAGVWAVHAVQERRYTLLQASL